MRLIASLAILTLSAALFSGCTSLSGGTTGALVGGLTGAGIGVIAGDPTAGALIGTGVGAGFGTLIGHENERTRRQQEGWVYDDPWGSSGHYLPRQQPAAYWGPPAPAPRSYTTESYIYSPRQPDRVSVHQTVYY